MTCLEPVNQEKKFKVTIREYEVDASVAVQMDCPRGVKLKVPGVEINFKELIN